MVNTVLGPLAPEKLGRTLIHEHFICSQGGWYSDASMSLYNRDEAFRVCVEIINKVKKQGIYTIVDCSPNDFPRDPKLLKRLSTETSINIICVTGMYNQMAGAPAYWIVQSLCGKDVVRMLSELFIREITVGIGDSGVKAGAIKVASGETISEYEEKVFKAAVVAQKATGVPIITHTEGPLVGSDQVALFEREGADMKKLLIGHVSNSRDFLYYKSLAAKANVGFDRFGLSLYTDDNVSMDSIVELIKQGYIDKIMLSGDSVCHWLGREGFKDIAAMMPDYRMDHLCQNILPAMKERGVTEEQIKIMMEDNPRNLLAPK